VSEVYSQGVGLKDLALVRVHTIKKRKKKKEKEKRMRQLSHVVKLVMFRHLM
jgi:predicted secreted acid phosphatase